MTERALYTVNELAEHLRVSRWTVYRLVERGHLRAVKVGEQLRFRPSDVDEYLEQPPATPALAAHLRRPH